MVKLPSEGAAAGLVVRRQPEIACEVHLHPMTLSDGDRWQSVEESVHHLKARLGSRVARAAGDDQRAISIAVAESKSTERLCQAADQADSSGGAERGPVVVVHAVS